MDYKIRELKQNEISVLNTFLYEAIFIPDIFGNTTLEFPTTLEYAKRFRENHPHAIFQVAQNKEQIFMDMVDVIGPPARMMRWCCSMFKTGPITRVLNSMYRNQQVLTFYGIRKD